MVHTQIFSVGLSDSDLEDWPFWSLRKIFNFLKSLSESFSSFSKFDAKSLERCLIAYLHRERKSSVKVVQSIVNIKLF